MCPFTSFLSFCFRNARIWDGFGVARGCESDGSGMISSPQGRGARPGGGGGEGEHARVCGATARPPGAARGRGAGHPAAAEVAWVGVRGKGSRASLAALAAPAARAPRAGLPPPSTARAHRSRPRALYGCRGLRARALFAGRAAARGGWRPGSSARGGRGDEGWRGGTGRVGGRPTRCHLAPPDAARETAWRARAPVPGVGARCAGAPRAPGADRREPLRGGSEDRRGRRAPLAA